MKSLIIGYGEIGKALHKIVGGDWCDKESRVQDKEYDILLVCIPYTGDFIDIIRAYQEEFQPKATIIFSTVPIGTCHQLDAVHSPVEGKHPELEKSMRIMKRYIGGLNDTATEFLSKYFKEIIYLPKPEYTEFLKLRSTSKYRVNIEWTRYEKGVCDDLDMDFDYIKDFDREYNRLYKELGMPEYQRYILDPPEGEIGGHCLEPNAKILNEQYPSEFLK